jgi:hypothetical protein
MSEEERDRNCEKVRSIVKQEIGADITVRADSLFSDLNVIASDSDLPGS